MKKLTEEEFKQKYADIKDFEKEVKSDIKHLKKMARKLYQDADRSGLFKKKYSKLFVHLDDIIFGNIL